uniref:Leucine-rich repeats and guanylate kinase domain containing n=1 Tax=Nothobranchius kadleci TaxID=1051664 RepID=A0A1A8BMY1_NOTKA
MKYGDHQFGLSRDAIEYVAREGLACCVSLELESLLRFRKSYFEPRCILLLPTQMETYRNTLSSRERYTPEQIEAAVSRLELYVIIAKEILSILSSATSSSASSLFLVATASKSYNKAGFTCRSFKIQTELNPERTLAELASIRRREQPVREAIVGKRPGVLSQLFKRKSSSQYHQDPGAHFVQKDNSSSDESCASSSLTVPSSASVLGKPLDESVLIHSLDSFKEYVISGQTSDRPQPEIDACTAVGSPANSRPGSRDYYEQPPTVIGANISAVSRPNPSPTPSLDLGLKVKGNENMEE